MAEIATASPDDAAGIADVHYAAFPSPSEATLVRELERDGDLIISLVAREDDKVTGHIAFSKMQGSADGKSVAALAMAPVAVLPERHGHGIGSALIRRGIEQSREQGWDIIFVLGDPNYYGRFGFSKEAAGAYECVHSGPYLQALTLKPDWQIPAKAIVYYAPAFEKVS